MGEKRGRCGDDNKEGNEVASTTISGLIVSFFFFALNVCFFAIFVFLARSPAFGGPALGPKSLGHVARFVLDHAPCPVLLLRLRLYEHLDT